MKTILILIINVIVSKQIIAQQQQFGGTWQGTLSVGVELRIVFHVSDYGNGHLKSTVDSPDQSAYGMICDTTFIRNKELVIEMKSLQASYIGKLEDDTTMQGLFTQGTGYSLTLIKTDHFVDRKRPQTPVGPFPYKTEDIIYSNSDGSLSYGATMTVPQGKRLFPAILLITGSGPQDRDETILGHKPFAVIADHLTRNGFIVLRVDDRGINKSTGDFSSATSLDFAKDVSAGVDYLLSRPEVNKKKIGLLGHSEGGMIAPMVANTRKAIRFLILLAAPGVKITELMAEQNAAIARSSGVSKKTLMEIKPLFAKVVGAIMKAPDNITAQKEVTLLTEEWAVKQPADILKELDFETIESRGNYVTSIIAQYGSPWFRYFMAFDPTRYLEQLKVSVLAINGDKDIQVISSQNLPAIERALKKSKSKNYLVKQLPGVNHLFQECKSCTLAEYAEMEQTIAPSVLSIITEWLNKNVK